MSNFQHTLHSIVGKCRDLVFTRKNVLRRSRGRFTIIIDAGIDPERFGIKIFDAAYLPGFDADADFHIDGFWNIDVDLLIVCFTFHIADRKCK